MTDGCEWQTTFAAEADALIDYMSRIREYYEQEFGGLGIPG